MACGLCPDLGDSKLIGCLSKHVSKPPGCRGHPDLKKAKQNPQILSYLQREVKKPLSQNLWGVLCAFFLPLLSLIEAFGDSPRDSFLSTLTQVWSMPLLQRSKKQAKIVNFPGRLDRNKKGALFAAESSDFQTLHSSLFSKQMKMYSPFPFWHISLSMMNMIISSCIRVAANGIPSSFFMAE